MPGEYRIKLLKGAQKDKENIRQFPSLKANVDALLAVLKTDLFQDPPPCERLLAVWRTCIPGASTASTGSRIRSGYGQQDRPYHFHVDALRINMPDAQIRKR